MKHIKNTFLIIAIGVIFSSCGGWRFHYRHQHPITFPGSGLMQEGKANKSQKITNNKITTKASKPLTD